MTTFDRMYLQKQIRGRALEFINLCKQHRVKLLFAFGSSINDSFKTPSSDIDLLIELDIEDPIARGEHLLLIWDQLEIFFNRKVDLLTDGSIKNPVLKEQIDSSKLLVYDGNREEISC